MPPNNNLIYSLNDFPPWHRSLIYGLQWAMVFLPLLIILSTVTTEYLGFKGDEKVLFFQRLLITTGGVMILQTLWGHRYPLLDGPSSALLLSLIILAPHGMPVIQGGMIFGGFILLLLSMFRLVRYLEPLFTDNVIGVILMLISVTLLPYLIPMVIGEQAGRPFGEPIIFGVSVLVILAIALFSHWLPGFPKTISLFLGIIFGTLLIWAFGRLNLGGVQEAHWFTVPRPLFPALPRLNVSATITFLMAYVAVIVNTVGSIYSIAEVVGKEALGSRVTRGVGFTGLGGVAAGALGVIGTVSFGISPGVVLVTQVGSRFAVTVCGVLLFSFAFFQKLLAILAMIPASTVAAAMITGLAAQVGAGIAVFTRSGKTLGARDYLVIGIPVLFGGMVSIMPEGFFQAFPPSVRALLKNGLIVGIFLVLFLEHLVLRAKK